MKTKLLFLLLLSSYLAFSQIQNINVGTSANDRTGDPLRTVFQKVNSNFAFLNSIGSAAGTNTYTVSLGTPITSYVTGQRFLISFANANTTASTLSIDGLVAKSIVKPNATALAANDILPGVYQLYYDGTNLQILGAGGNTVGSSGTVTSVSVTTANGISGSVATATTTPAISLTLGAITPTTVNGITLSGSASPTLAITGTSTISGANTGDQDISGKANLAGPTTFTGTITLPSTTSIGSVSNTEIGYVDGVTSALQTQLDTKQERTREYAVSCSDLTSTITTGTNKSYFRIPRGFTVTAVRASLITAQSSGSLMTIDINESGTTILSTKLTIDNSEKTSVTAATAYVLSDTSISDDAEMSIDIDAAGTGGAGLIVWIIGY